MIEKLAKLDYKLNIKVDLQIFKKILKLHA